MKIVLFEDENFKNLLPLVYFRPVWELRCGAFTLAEKIQFYFKNNRVLYFPRRYLQENYLSPANLPTPHSPDDFLFMNGRVLADGESIRQCQNLPPAHYLSNDDEIIAFRSSSANWTDYFSEGILLPDRIKNDFQAVSSGKKLLKYAWDFIYSNGDQIISDFSLINGTPGIAGQIDPNVNFLGKENIYLSAGARIMPGVTINAENGLVWIDEGAKVMPNAVLTGPVYIGKRSLIKIAAKIWEDTSIGPVCKVGGDVEGSIILSYSNKQHEGFLGHSYLGEWINIGADTNNSDLKNNYGNVSVFLNGYPVNTGKQFMGLIMGDHSKTAINSMFNTGTIVGVNCNVFGAGFPPKFIPSFSWGGSSGLREYNFEKSLDVAELVMKRRQKSLAKKDRQLFKAVKDLAMKIENRARITR